MAKILVVEDQPEQAETVKEWLERDHHQVEIASDGDEASFLLSTYAYDIVLLDWDLPKLSGLEVLRRYRNGGGKAHLIMLTGKRDIDSKELGLDGGADDYLTKPFEPRELSSRIRAVQRRPTLGSDNILRCGPILLDVSKGKVVKGSEEVQLMPQEYALLEFLMRHPQQIFSADALLNHVWKSASDATGIAVRTSIMRLRKKLQIEGKPPFISTVHGIGYRLEVVE